MIEWFEIFPGKYAINRKGQVLSIHRIDSLGRKQGGFIVKQHITNTGYYSVALRPESKQINFSIHRLLAKVFIPNSENKPCINHKDGNRLNNSLDNLEWATFSENNSHAHRVGKQRNYYGEKHHRSKLNWEKVREIRRKYVKGRYSLRQLATDYSISKGALQGILSHKTWKNEYSNQ